MFEASSIELTGGFLLPVTPEAAFEFFSPLGEKLWVPGWDPELIYPPGVSWARGLVFRTREERGEAVWVVMALDRERHAVEYHRVESGRYVARVDVRCEASAAGTDVTVSYLYVGLTEVGNLDIEAMSSEAFAERMGRWQGWICTFLAGR